MLQGMLEGSWFQRPLRKIRPLEKEATETRGVYLQKPSHSVLHHSPISPCLEVHCPLPTLPCANGFRVAKCSLSHRHSCVSRKRSSQRGQNICNANAFKQASILNTLFVCFACSAMVSSCCFVSVLRSPSNVLFPFLLPGQTS